MIPSRAAAPVPQSTSAPPAFGAQGLRSIWKGRMRRAALKPFLAVAALNNRRRRPTRARGSSRLVWFPRFVRLQVQVNF